MNLVESVLYPVFISEDDGVFLVRFPDEEVGATFGQTWEDAVAAAKDLIGMHLVSCEEEKAEMKIPTVDAQDAEDGENLIYIDVWMPLQRSMVKTTFKKKTLTIPTWIDLLATQKNINFSQILVDGLKAELGI